MRRVFIFFVAIFLFNLTVSAVDLTTALRSKLDNPQALNAPSDLVKNAAQYYKQRQFQQIWVEGNSFTTAARIVLDVLKNAAKEGLEPHDYKKASKLFKEAQKNPARLLDAEIAITSLVLEYIDDLMGERLNPRKIGKALYLKAKNIDAVQIMKDGMRTDPSAKWLQVLTIQHPEYQMLKKELAYYLGRQGQSSYPKLSLGAKIELGNKGGRIETLQWQLSSLGYLSGVHQQGTVDAVTDLSIRAFQEANNLKADGVVGPKTIRVLNSHNVEDRLRQIIVSMERWRWLPENLGNRYVLVNIAGFELTAFEEGTEKLRMPVIIGRKYRKTPVFSSDIYSVRFNPSWHVPRSIAVKDKLRKIRRDPGYLTRGGYVLYDAGGARISPQSVDWSSVSASNFNFRIRQNPGNHNALGKIRFAIKSPFNVYLHSTPDKHLFKKNQRSFSSGCIRVGDPKALALFVFNDVSTWPYDRIEQNMQGTKTQNVALSHPVKVYITYFTVWKDKDGKPHYSQDIYGQDLAIWSALKSRKGHKV